MRRILTIVTLLGLAGCSDGGAGQIIDVRENPIVVPDFSAPQPPPLPRPDPRDWLVAEWDVFFVANQSDPRDAVWDSTITFRANGIVDVPGDPVLYAARSLTVTFTYTRSNVTLPGLCDVTLTLDGNRLEGVYKIRGGPRRDAFAVR